MSYFPKPSLNENDLAIIERGDTAAHSIEAGQYVSWKGRTGKAKAAILQGATLEDTLFDYSENGVINEFNASILIRTVTLLSTAGGRTSNSKDVSYPGYTAIGVIGATASGAEHGVVYLFDIYIDISNQRLRASWWDNYANCGLNAKILYVKNMEVTTM